MIDAENAMIFASITGTENNISFINSLGAHKCIN